jgi:hypothetical protein
MKKKNEKKETAKRRVIQRLHLVSHCSGETKNAKRTHIRVHEKREDFVQIKKNASRRKEEEEEEGEENHYLQSTTFSGRTCKHILT